MDYSELIFTINPCNDSTQEILAAELSELGFEGFVESDTGFTAYIVSSEFVESAINYLLFQLKQNKIEVSYKMNSISQQNWNSEWEKNFNPVIINEDCIIRAPFHEKKTDIKYDILIQPDMTFGTGHHETTYLMISEMLCIDFCKKIVLDMGCGTGVLAILASKLGAEKITAIDNDKRAFENTLENIKLNGVKNIQVKLGTSDLLGTEYFDIILANIAKNIILAEVKKYAKMLVNNGILICSGFFQEDHSDVEKEMKLYGLNLLNTQTKNNWILQSYIKQ